MQVDRGVAVAGDQPQCVAQCGQPAAGVAGGGIGVQHAMFIATIGKAQRLRRRQAVQPGQAGINGVGLVAGVADGVLGRA